MPYELVRDIKIGQTWGQIKEGGYHVRWEIVGKIDDDTFHAHKTIKKGRKKIVDEYADVSRQHLTSRCKLEDTKFSSELEIESKEMGKKGSAGSRLSRVIED